MEVHGRTEEWENGRCLKSALVCQLFDSIAFWRIMSILCVSISIMGPFYRVFIMVLRGLLGVI